MKIEQVAKEAALKLHHLMLESREDLAKCMDEVLSECEAQEEPQKFRIGFTITLDHDESKMTCCLTYAVRRKLQTEQDLPDGSQPELPLQPIVEPDYPLGEKEEGATVATVSSGAI